jgi:glycosyltransferase involved in cell wall biosynthesis
MSRQKEEILVSVIMPTYNRGHLISRAIESVLGQTYENIELIIVDDGSTDNTPKIVEKYLEEQRNIRYFYQKKNRGGNVVRNIGLKEARGQFIAFLDSDDEWLETKTAKQLNVFHSSTANNLGLVYCGVNFIFPNRLEHLLPSLRGDALEKILIENQIVGGGSSSLIKKEVFDKIGLFDESDSLRRGGAQEYELWIRLVQFYELEAINEYLLNYFVTDDSVTLQSSSTPLLKARSRQYIVTKHIDLYKRFPNALAYRTFVIGSYYLTGNKRIKASSNFLKAFFLSKSSSYWQLFIASLFGEKSFLKKFETIKSQLP